MNKRQKAILVKFVAVILLTALAVVAMVPFRDWVNRSEAMRAMQYLGKEVLKYRKTHGSVPHELYVNEIRENLPGNVRLGNLQYRARWLDFAAPPETILAYTEKKYHSLLLRNGFIVLRLNGNVEWMDTQQFKDLLATQQSPQEIELLRK